MTYLSELPGDANSPAQPIAADQQSLHSPAPEMPKSKYIKVAEDSLPGDNMTVHSILLLMKRTNFKKRQNNLNQQASSKILEWRNFFLSSAASLKL